MIERADNFDHGSMLQRAQARFDYLLRTQAGQLSEQPFILREDVHFGSHRAGAKRQNPHAGSLQLFRNRFREGEHEGLGAAYTAKCGKGWKATTDVKLITAPHFRWIISLRICRVKLTRASTLSRIAPVSSASGVVRKSP